MARKVTNSGRAEVSDRLSPSRGEEIANSISHGVGAVAALAAAPFLVIVAVRRGGPVAGVAAGVFAGSVVLLYLASTLYHALPQNLAKRVFRIFLLIAGTYTPFTVGLLRGAWGWVLFAFVWTMAVVGMTFKAVAGIRYPRLSTIVYVAMGWVALVAIRPLWLHLPAAGWVWLIGGGIAYTGGVAFYACDRRLPYGHFVWHLFVLVGTTCHFFAVLWYAV